MFDIGGSPVEVESVLVLGLCAIKRDGKEDLIVAKASLDLI